MNPISTFSGEIEALLEEVFEFSADDVLANRDGRMSKAQHASAFRRHRENSRLAWVAFSIILGLGFVGGSIEILRTDRNWIEFFQAFLVFTICFALVILGFIAYHRNQLLKTVRGGEILETEGEIKIICVRGEKLVHWYFIVGQCRTLIERGDHRILLQQSGVEGKRARAFYSLPRGDLLSVILLPERQPEVGGKDA